MIKPTIHLNGSSAGNLSAGYRNAGKAVRAAYEAAQATAPNARDYYPQGEAAFPAARDEHRARLVKLEAVLAEFEALYLEVDRQRTGRTPR